MRFEDEFIYELPFEAGSQFRVSQGYGGDYSHTGDSHYSLDFRMPEGTTICAARSGVVYRVVDHFAEGGTHPSFKPKANAIHVLHVDDTIASYLHLMKKGTFVRAGEFVSIGQPIGASGNTGWSGQPHLHFHVADAFFHKRTPTVFNVDGQADILKPNRWYTRPQSENASAATIRKPQGVPECRSGARDRDAFAFSAELLDCRHDLLAQLSEAGYELTTDYSSVDVLHDVHGLEVCGIHNADSALQITRLLLRTFPGWNAGWLHPPDSSSEQEWVASIQRDRDLVMEYWDAD